jgi:hypothetical protein
MSIRIGLCIIFSIVVLAAPPTAAGVDNDQAARDALLERVGRANVTTGVLYDLVMPLSGIERFDGSKASRPVTLRDWKQLYHELHRAALARSVGPALPLLMQQAGESIAAGPIPIGIVNMQYNRLRDDIREDLRREDPCIEATVFAAAALRDRTYHGSAVTFVTGRRWYFTGEDAVNGTLPERIEIDFGDGTGFRPAPFGEPVTVSYAGTGTRTCRLRAVMPGGIVEYAAFRFDVIALETPAPHDTIHVTATIPYESQYASGDAYIYLADSLAPLACPVVVLEGFDMDNTMFWDELYNDLNQEDLIERVRAEGFDVIVLNFFDSVDYIQRNSFVVVELLSQIQAMIPPSRDIALIGASMGGLCGRYALTYMEQNGPAHRVRTFISLDVPHRGANIPLGIQYWVKFFSEQSAAAGEMLTGLESPAARQMLEYHFTDPPGTTGESDPLRSVLLGEFSALGGYPSALRKIAVANGSGHAAGQEFSPGEQIIFYEYGSLLVDIIGNVWAVADGSNHIIFDGLIDMIWPLPDDEMVVYAQDTRPLDNAPGGSRPSMAQMDSTEAPYGDIVALHERHCFVPTVSALDIDTDDLFYDVAGDPSIMSRTPFDSIFWAPVNEGHIFISPECADLLLAEVRIGVTGDDPPLPRADRTVLRQNRPNPFNPATTIKYGLPSAGHVLLCVYDVAGRLVRTLIDGNRPAGWHEAAWDGLDEAGRPAASGVYFCRLASPRSRHTIKMILLR